MAGPKLKQSGLDQFEGVSFGRFPSPAPSVEAVGDTVQGSLEVEVDPQKHPRPQGDIVQTYVPKWGVLVSDVVACPAPTSVKVIGPDICRSDFTPRRSVLCHGRSFVGLQRTYGSSHYGKPFCSFLVYISSLDMSDISIF